MMENVHFNGDLKQLKRFEGDSKFEKRDLEERVPKILLPQKKKVKEVSPENVTISSPKNDLKVPKYEYRY
jgi:hypothetical protein